jgi:hypothetical protein
VTPVDQPLILPFPGYPQWALAFCTCRLAEMDHGQPTLPAHAGAGITIERPEAGAGFGCLKCYTFWLYRGGRGDWGRFPLQNIVVDGRPLDPSEQTALYREGYMNMHMDLAAPTVDLSLKPEPPALS